MKPILNSFSKIAAVAAAGTLLVGQDAQAQKKKSEQKPDIQFSELQDNLSFDRSAVSDGAPDGLVTSYSGALEKVMPTVVTVYSSKKRTVQRNPAQEEMFRRMFPDIPEDFFERNQNRGQRESGLGSGVVISPNGYILTNNHVITGADEIKVSLSKDKREYVAQLVGADPQTDVALIKIDATGLDAIQIGDSSKLKIGDVTIAVGSPLGLTQTATMGIVSALGRNDLQIIGSQAGVNGYENFIQTDASINRGNSGGALVDARGRLIGINTAIQSNSFGGNIGIGFAIPSNMALNIVERLLDGGGKVKRGFLGVLLREPDDNIAKALGREDKSGVLVAEVGEDSPAERSGLKAGDLIVGYNGKPVESMAKLRLDISNTAPGSPVEFQLIRNGNTQSRDVVLGDLDDRDKIFATGPGRGPAPRAVAKPKQLVEGLRITDLDEDKRKALELDADFAGVLVESVEDDSAAAKAGLRPGLVITQIDQKNVGSVSQAHDIIGGVNNDYVLFQVYSNGRRDILAVELKK